jgi:hypothetical protein
MNKIIFYKQNFFHFNLKFIYKNNFLWISIKHFFFVGKLIFWFIILILIFLILNKINFCLYLIKFKKIVMGCV